MVARIRARSSTTISILDRRERSDERLGRERGRDQRQGKGDEEGEIRGRTYMGTSYPQAKFGTINRNEQDQIPPLY
jgi:hypothetical protein